MGDLSTNFSRIEFACGCGCGLDTVDAELLAVAEDIRSEFGRVSVTSGCRCTQYNATIGGSIGSQHIVCRAMDFVTELGTPAEVQAWLKARYPGKYGIGSYSGWTHIDTRGGSAARWNG